MTIKHDDLRDLLIEAGVADTRVTKLRMGLGEIHEAFAYCDEYNRNLIIKKFPFIAQCAKFYGANENMCDEFEHQKISMGPYHYHRKYQ